MEWMLGLGMCGLSLLLSLLFLVWFLAGVRGKEGALLLFLGLN
jgi:hypothetical protein